MSALLEMWVRRRMEGLIDGGMAEWVFGWKMSVGGRERQMNVLVKCWSSWPIYKDKDKG
jgi:hypothetical protein